MSKLGFAVDIGTSQITTQLVNLETGDIVSELSDTNPQKNALFSTRRTFHPSLISLYFFINQLISSDLTLYTFL